MVSTLDKMREAGLDVDDEGSPPEDKTPDLELEPEGEATPGEGELVLEGDETHAADEQHQQSVEVPKATLSKLRRTRREARQQAEQKDQENAQLRAELDALKGAVLKKPQYTDFKTDEEYEQALLQYHRLQGTGAPAATPPASAPPQQPQQAVEPRFDDAVNEHLDRAEKLGVDVVKFAQADRVVRDALSDIVVDALIDAVGPGSEKAMMILGTRPGELAKVQQLLAGDPSGLKVPAHLARLAERVTVKGKTISGAPKPTRSPTGGAKVLTDDAEFSKREAELEKKGDVQGMVELRRKRRKARAAAS